MPPAPDALLLLFALPAALAPVLLRILSQSFMLREFDAAAGTRRPVGCPIPHGSLSAPRLHRPATRRHRRNLRRAPAARRSRTPRRLREARRAAAERAIPARKIRAVIRTRAAARIAVQLAFGSARVRATHAHHIYKGKPGRRTPTCVGTRAMFAYTARPASARFRAVITQAGVAELVDAPDSKSGYRKVVWVRFPPPAPAHIPNLCSCP